MNTIRDHLESVRAQIAEAEAAAGRPADSVRLLAVSKTFPAEDVAEAFACGQTCFGENRVQELASKVPALPGGIEWHLIGSLQSNKAAKAAALASWIHSVDSEKLVRKISTAADSLGKTVNILFEVNSGEENKTGFRSDDELRASLEAALALPGGGPLVIEGDGKSGEVRRNLPDPVTLEPGACYGFSYTSRSDSPARFAVLEFTHFLNVEMRCTRMDKG